MSIERNLMGTADAASTPGNYIEDVFKVSLYTGTSTIQTIANGINLAGLGGLVWVKARSVAGGAMFTSGIQPNNHTLFDTVRTNQNAICCSYDFQQDTTWGSAYFNFLSNGFNTGTGANTYINASGVTYGSWTFREQAKFFDVVTYTGNGAARTIAHNLGSVPGMIIVKCVSATAPWAVYHRSLTSAGYWIQLDSTNGQVSDSTAWNSTAPTSSVFSVGTSANTNTNGNQYIAYLFAHNAGGFGVSDTDNVISCASYTGNGSASGPTITIGYEPQYLMIKNASGTGNWQILDSTRGMPVGGADATLQPNLGNAETAADYVSPNSTGFQVVSTSSEVNTSGSTYVYLAIRKGPMRP